MSENRKWFALYTRPRHEFKAELELVEKGIETYLPKITKMKKWSDRNKKVTEPLFKSYIFIYVNERERYFSVQSKSIVKVVNFRGVPASLPDWQIENLKKLLSSNPDAFLNDLIKIGTHVKIVDGPFAGVEGIIAKHNNDENILGVNIELLQRSVVVHLPASYVAVELEKNTNEVEEVEI